MKFYKKILLFLIIGFCTSSCVTNKRLRYMQDPGGGIPSYEKMVTPEDYRVQVFDELSVNIATLDPQMTDLFNMASSSNNGEFSSSSSSSNLNSYTIEEDGCILFPYIGRVNVLNKTTREIKLTISEMLTDFLKKDFTVSVNLSNSYFSILGEAKNGRYAITKERMNIFQAVAQAGDLGDYADRAHIKMIRQTVDGPIVREFDLRSKDIVDSEFYYIQPNDVIYVQLFNGQYFQLNSFGAWFSFITTVISFSYIIARFDHIF